jgi:PhnB protein
MEPYSGLIPHLVVSNAAKAIEFYKAGLGATELSRMPAPDGRIMHAALKVEGSQFFLNDDFPEHCGGLSRVPKDDNIPLTLHVVVPNADAAIERAAKAGAKVKMPAMDMFWGDRYGQVVDPFKFTWSFSHPLTAEQKAEAQKAWAAMQGQIGK